MGEGETTQPNIQLRRLGPPHTGRHFIQAMKIPCNWLISHCGLIKDTAADVDDEEELVEPHIADHCHRSHKPVCDPGPGRGDPAKPFLRRSLCRVAWNRVSTALLLFRAGLVPKSGPANHAEIYGRAARHRGFNLFQHRSVGGILKHAAGAQQPEHNLQFSALLRTLSLRSVPRLQLARM